MINIPGPGDSITWGPYYGHPNDPRVPIEGVDCEKIVASITARLNSDTEKKEEKIIALSNY